MSAEHWCEWLLDDVIQNSITIDEWRTHKVNLIFHNKYALYSRLILSQEKYRNFALLHDTKEVTYLDSHRVPPNLCGTLVGMFNYRILWDLSRMSLAKFSVVCLLLFYYIPKSSSLPCLMSVLCMDFWLSWHVLPISASEFSQFLGRLCGYIKTVRWISAYDGDETCCEY